MDDIGDLKILLKSFNISLFLLINDLMMLDRDDDMMANRFNEC